MQMCIAVAAAGMAEAMPSIIVISHYLCLRRTNSGRRRRRQRNRKKKQEENKKKLLNHSCSWLYEHPSVWHIMPLQYFTDLYRVQTVQLILPTFWNGPFFLTSSINFCFTSFLRTCEFELPSGSYRDIRSLDQPWGISSDFLRCLRLVLVQ